MMVLHFDVQGEDSIEHTSGKCHAFTFLACKKKIVLRIFKCQMSFVCILVNL